MVQDAPAFKLVPHGADPLGVAVKYPLPVMLVRFTAAEVVFLMVVVFELETLSTTLPKLWLAGLKVKGAVGPFCPVPVMPPAAIGVPEPLAVMVSAPLINPFVVGEKLTPKVHLAFEFRVPLQGEVPLPTAEKSPLVAKV